MKFVKNLIRNTVEVESEFKSNGNLEKLRELTLEVHPLVKKNSQLIEILDQVPITIFLKDLEDRIIFVNRDFLKKFDFENRKQVEGQFANEISANADKDYYANDVDVIQSGIEKRNIIERVVINGIKRIFSTDKIPFKNKEGEIEGVLGVSIDLTDRKEGL